MLDNHVIPQLSIWSFFTIFRLPAGFCIGRLAFYPSCEVQKRAIFSMSARAWHLPSLGGSGASAVAKVGKL